MTPERWKEVKAVLAAALEKTPEQRDDYLNRVCVDQSMRRELDSLLATQAFACERRLDFFPSPLTHHELKAYTESKANLSGGVRWQITR